MRYKNLQPVYALNFVNAEFMKDVDDYYHYYHLVHDKYTDKVIDGLHFIFVELPKFKPQTISERKMQVLWLRFLTEIDENTREAPAELLENTEVNEALEILERAAFTDAEMRAYDKFWDRVSTMRTLEGDWEDKIKEANDRLNEANDKLNEANAKLNETKAEAEAKLRQEKYDTARKLKAMNVMTTGQISEVTGLSNTEIEGL
jgi:predicted transposase/invertase (TIGR01784 family)